MLFQHRFVSKDSLKLPFCLYNQIFFYKWSFTLSKNIRNTKLSFEKSIIEGAYFSCNLKS